MMIRLMFSDLTIGVIPEPETTRTKKGQTNTNDIATPTQS